MIRYEIRIGGDLPAALLANLTEVVSVQPAGTMVEVDLPDDSALWGLIDALQHAGIDLLGVHRQSAEPEVS
jgi:hypothetical protein